MDRVFREMEAAGVPPPLITDDGGVVTVMLYAIKSSLTDAARLGLNERQTRALAILTEQERITNQEYRELFNVSHTTAADDLRDLLAKGLVKQAGTGRGTYYCPVNDPT